MVTNEPTKRRGRTILRDVRRAKDHGETIPIEWNERNQASGDNRTTLAGYVGSVARSHVSINLLWKQVEEKTKDAIWQDVQVHIHH